MKNFLTTFVLILGCVLILGFSLRGNLGNPERDTISTDGWVDHGPLELSPERGRFALTFTIVEDRSHSFSLPIARFITPDLGYINGKYVSLFAPGISYLVIPGYILGKFFNISQVGTYAVISIFALLNVLLIRATAIRLGINRLSSTLGGLAFLFASPAFAYGVSLYQHHVSTFLILASLYLYIRWNTFWSLALIFLLCATSLTIDYPNLFLVAPISIAAALRFFSVEKTRESINISFSLLRVFSIGAVVFPLAFFLWFNYTSYGNPMQLAGTVSTVKAIDADGKPTTPDVVGKNEAQSLLRPEDQNKSAVAFFKSRYILNGLQTHFVNRDRGILWFTPVMLLAIPGAFALYKKNKTVSVILVSTIGVNILLYSMWGDPYGGWAFGSRYLIPAYAVSSIFLASSLAYVRKYWIVPVLFVVLFVYSVSVNTLGALTSNRIPPKVEVLGIEALTNRQEKYSYDRNWDYLVGGEIKSFAYRNYFVYQLKPELYYYSVLGFILIFTSLFPLGSCLNEFIEKRSKK